MTIKDQLTEKKQQLLDMEPAISADDVSVETLAKADELIKKLQEL